MSWTGVGGYIRWRADGLRRSDMFIALTSVWQYDPPFIRPHRTTASLARKLLIAASAATSRDNAETQKSGARRICSCFASSTGNGICRRRRRFRRCVALPSSSGPPGRLPLGEKSNRDGLAAWDSNNLEAIWFCWHVMHFTVWKAVG